MGCCGQSRKARLRPPSRWAPVLRRVKLGTRFHGLVLLLAPGWSSRRYRDCIECKRRHLRWDGGWALHHERQGSLGSRDHGRPTLRTGGGRPGPQALPP